MKTAFVTFSTKPPLKERIDVLAQACQQSRSESINRILGVVLDLIDRPDAAPLNRSELLRLVRM